MLFRSELAAGRAGQELGGGDEIGEGGLGQPAPSLDVVAPEVAEVCDGTAERGQAQGERRPEDLARSAAPRSIAGGRPASLDGTSTRTARPKLRVFQGPWEAKAANFRNN